MSASIQQDASTMTSLDCPELAGVHVLVVDDDDDSREMLATILTHSGAVVTQAGSVADALLVFQNGAPPRLMVSDIGLPVEDGFSLLRKIRALEAERGGKVRAIALSGYGSDDDRKRSREGGFEAHFTKPVALHELLAAVQALLR